MFLFSTKGENAPSLHLQHYRPEDFAILLGRRQDLDCNFDRHVKCCISNDQLCSSNSTCFQCLFKRSIQ